MTDMPNGGSLGSLDLSDLGQDGIERFIKQMLSHAPSSSQLEETRALIAQAIVENPKTSTSIVSGALILSLLSSSLVNSGVADSGNTVKSGVSPTLSQPESIAPLSGPELLSSIGVPFTAGSNLDTLTSVTKIFSPVSVPRANPIPLEIHEDNHDALPSNTDNPIVKPEVQLEVTEQFNTLEQQAIEMLGGKNISNQFIAGYTAGSIDETTWLEIESALSEIGLASNNDFIVHPKDETLVPAFHAFGQQQGVAFTALVNTLAESALDIELESTSNKWNATTTALLYASMQQCDTSVIELCSSLAYFNEAISAENVGKLQIYLASNLGYTDISMNGAYDKATQEALATAIRNNEITFNASTLQKIQNATPIVARVEAKIATDVSAVLGTTEAQAVTVIEPETVGETTTEQDEFITVTPEILMSYISGLGDSQSYFIGADDTLDIDRGVVNDVMVSITVENGSVTVDYNGNINCGLGETVITKTVIEGNTYFIINEVVSKEGGLCIFSDNLNIVTTNGVSKALGII